MKNLNNEFFNSINLTTINCFDLIKLNKALETQVAGAGETKLKVRVFYNFQLHVGAPKAVKTKELFTLKGSVEKAKEILEPRKGLIEVWVDENNTTFVDYFEVAKK